MNQRDRDALDRHITGNYGEDQFREGSDEPVPVWVTITLPGAFVDWIKQTAWWRGCQTGANDASGHLMLWNALSDARYRKVGFGEQNEIKVEYWQEDEARRILGVLATSCVESPHPRTPGQLAAARRFLDQ